MLCKKSRTSVGCSDFFEYQNYSMNYPMIYSFKIIYNYTKDNTFWHDSVSLDNLKYFGKATCDHLQSFTYYYNFKYVLYFDKFIASRNFQKV